MAGLRTENERSTLINFSWPPSIKRVFFVSVLVLLVVGISGGIVWAAVSNKCSYNGELWCFSENSPAVASEVNDNFQYLDTHKVPPGAVMPFDLDSCPEGWSAFSNANGRVIVGTGGSLSRGSTAGSNSITLSVNNMPSHNHVGTTGVGNSMFYRTVGDPGLDTLENHTTGYSGGSNYTDRTDTNYPLRIHTHNFTTSFTGSDAAFDNRQPSIALLFCKKN